MHLTPARFRSTNDFWLAIPTPAAGKSTRAGSITAGDRERCTGLRLRCIYRRREPRLLVADGRLNTKGRAVASRSKTGRGVVTAPIFVLVPQVKLPKRLDLARDAERAILCRGCGFQEGARVPGMSVTGRKPQAWVKLL